MGGPPLGMAILGLGPVGSRVLGAVWILSAIPIGDQLIDFLAGLSYPFLF